MSVTFNTCTDCFKNQHLFVSMTSMCHHKHSTIMDWIFFLLKKQIPFRPIKILCFETKVTTSMCNIKSVERIPINLSYIFFRFLNRQNESAALQIYSCST